MTDATAEEGRVVEEATLAQAMRGFARWQFRQPTWIAIYVVAGITALLTAVAALGGRDLLAPTAFLLGTVGALAIVWWVMVRSALRRSYPPGSVAAAIVTEDSLVSVSALGRSEMRFAAFRRVDVSGAAVVLKVASWAGAIGIMPRALLSDADLARLQTGIAAARTTRR